MKRSAPEFKDFPSLVQIFDLARESAVLLIVDMQHFAVHPDYGWGPVLKKHYPTIYAYYFGRLANEVIPNIARLLSFFRDNRLTVLFCTVGPRLPDGCDYLRSRREAARSGLVPALSPVSTQGHKILEDLDPKEDELVLNKISRGAFTSTGIDLVLRNLGRDTLVVTGVHTNGCVETTARQAADLGYKTVLVDDATACFDEKMHDATIRTFRLLLGNVLSTEGVIEQLSLVPKDS